MSDYIKTRSKTWEEKCLEVIGSVHRATKSELFAKNFYKNLFYLNPDLEEKFKDTDWRHQEIAIIKGIQHLVGFFNKKDITHHKHVIRIGETHSKKNLNIHPHSYYYWIDAMVMTLKEFDNKWHDDLEYYTRECLFFPVSFIISMYHK